MAEETELQRAVLYINENPAPLPNQNNCDPTWNYIWDANLSLKIAETTQRQSQYTPQTLLPYAYAADPKRFLVAPYEECNTNFRQLPESDKPAESEPTPKSKPKPTTDKQHKCPVEGCLKAFRMPYELKRHSFTHSSDRPFKCDECGREFARKDYLNRHIKSHIHEPKIIKTFKCEPTETNIMTNNYQFQQNHQYEVKVEKVDPQVADLSGLQSLDKPAPSRSKSKPPVEKHNKCPVEGCGKAFQMPYQLKRHSLTHSSDRPFKCDKCGQAFSRKDYMSKHFKTHLPKPNFKPFKCDFPNCTKEFARNDKLVSHRATHMQHLK